VSSSAVGGVSSGQHGEIPTALNLSFLDRDCDPSLVIIINNAVTIHKLLLPKSEEELKILGHHCDSNSPEWTHLMHRLIREQESTAQRSL
jgi:hypothetical protein